MYFKFGKTSIDYCRNQKIRKIHKTDPIIKIIRNSTKHWIISLIWVKTLSMINNEIASITVNTRGWLTIRSTLKTRTKMFWFEFGSGFDSRLGGKFGISWWLVWLSFWFSVKSRWTECNWCLLHVLRHFGHVAPYTDLHKHFQIINNLLSILWYNLKIYSDSLIKPL